MASDVNVGESSRTGFIIKNDGFPVDIELSHGSDRATPGSGNCAVNINNTQYMNSGTKDNTWNMQWFCQYEVNPNVHTVKENGHANEHPIHDPKNDRTNGLKKGRANDVKRGHADGVENDRMKGQKYS
ncbi:hypothetical protein H2201_004885 [Coniosporium apollinis]|uniref:Pectate lyase n=1 Tax=Coniosporium apollinis TaxID=61459 RepID=A0ABQ9NUN5_9PEZI|nr:hypothetical protein H2201_004885 [Coniosporium apollinis]